MLENIVIQHIIIDPAGQLKPGTKEKGSRKREGEKENRTKKEKEKKQLQKDETNTLEIDR